MLKVSIIGTKARDKALKGANYIADAVKSTIGPFGQNALIEKGNRITNDGVTISRELCGAIEDEFERRGATVLHEASSKTNDQVGDATSTSEALAQAIIKEAIRFLPSEGTFVGKKTPAEVSKLISSGKDEVVESLSKQIMEVTDEQSLINSAKVSVEDDELAQLIGSAQWKLGKEGMIIAEETAELNSSIQNIKGVRIDNGFGTSVVINNQEKQQLEVENLSVILTNHTLQDLNPLKSVIDQLVKAQKRDIAVIARGFSADCIKVCLENFKNGVRFYPINAPYTDQKEVMKDLAAVLGATYIDTEEGSLEDMNISDVGFASKIIARRFDAIITGQDDNLTKERVQKRIQETEKALIGSVSDFEKKQLESRLSQLKNGFALLKVGATSEAERKYKKDKADDAVNAVRLALKGGTVKGGGLAFKEISEQLPDGHILKRPLTVIYDQIISSAPEGFIIEDWVRDPFLVLKAALENACSVASILATTNIVIASSNPVTCGCHTSSHEE